MTFSFHPEAKEEFDGAIQYYEKCEAGLGYDFALEVYASIKGIVNYPCAWPVIESDLRRCLVNRFPYGIIYSAEPSGIFILAVMHLHQRPGYWKVRM